MRARRLVELKGLLLAAAAAYLGIAALAWLFQEHLMFFPRPAPAHVQAPPGWHIEEVLHTTADGTRLAGVLVLPPVERSPLVIYFGGNAEEVTEAAAGVSREYGERAVLLVNYRGYGRSAGRPGERALVGDALELYDVAAKHPAIDPGRIAVHGRSLGSAMAVQVAAARPVKCVVLTSPFASALDVARDAYGWLPVAWLMRHRFDGAAAAARAKAPLLVLVGEEDTIIAPRHSDRLASLWAGPVERVPLAGYGHNDLHIDPRYSQAIHAFLDRRL